MYRAKPHNPALAAGLIAVATAFIAATTLIAKALGTDQFGPAIHPFQIVFGRFLFAFLAFSIAGSNFKADVATPSPWPAFGKDTWRMGGVDAHVRFGCIHPAGRCDRDFIYQPGLWHDFCDSVPW